MLHCYRFSRPQRNVTDQTNYSRPGRVWSVTSRLGTEKSVTFFTVYTHGRSWLFRYISGFNVRACYAVGLHVIRIQHFTLTGPLARRAPPPHAKERSLLVSSVAKSVFKGSPTREFELQVFFINQCPPGP